MEGLRRELDAVLKPFMASADPQPLDVTLPSGVELKLFRAPGPKATFFRPAGHSDEHSGGFLIGEIETNLKLCIAEKTTKIANYRAKYPEWWLVLLDHIGYALDPFEQELFQARVSLTHTFDKVILLDPRDAGRSFGLNSASATTLTIVWQFSRATRIPR